MATQWFYLSDGKQMGPCAWAELQQLSAARQLLPDDLVRTADRAQWQPAWNIHGLFAEEAPHSPPSLPPSPPPSAGIPTASDDWPSFQKLLQRIAAARPAGHRANT